MSGSLQPSGSDLSTNSPSLITDTLVSDSAQSLESSDSDSDSENDDNVMIRMKELLLKAKLSARANEAKKLNLDELKNNEAVVLFSDEEEEEEVLA